MRKALRFIRRAAGVGAVVLVVVAPAAATNGKGDGGGNAAKALPPAAAAAAASAPGIAIASAAQRVSPAAALAAGNEPGADTEVAPGMTPAQAVGMSWTSGPRQTASARRAAGGTLCQSIVMGEIWGLWPYTGEVDDSTYWCGDGVTISYRTTHVTLNGRGGLCSPHDAYGFKVAGGVGSYYEQETVGGYFDCPTTYPWITLHYNHHFDGVVTADGGAYVTNISG